MIISLRTFFTGLAIYSALTLPSVVIPTIYILSLVYAFTFGSIAFLIFTLTLYILKSIQKLNTKGKWVILIVSLIIGVAIGHHCIGLFGGMGNVWEFNAFLLFPLTAIVSGCISVYINRQQIVNFISASEADLEFKELLNNDLN